MRTAGISLTTLAFSLLLSGCQIPWGEKTSDPAPIDNKIGAEAKCLSGLGPVMEGFMDGTASAEKVSGIWTCFDNALGLVEKKVVGGEDPRYYTGRELAKFFETSFLAADVTINERLLGEIMHFKQLVVGGDARRITRPELARLRVFAREMRSISLELLPQMKILSKNWQVTGANQFDGDLAAFEAAKEVSYRVADRLIGLIEPQKQKYEISNFVVLLEELQSVFKKKWGATESLGKLIPLLGRLKGALTGTEEAVIQPQDWRNFGRLGIRAYLQYLRYYYFFQKNPHRGSDPELVLVFKSIDDVMGTVSEILAQKATRLLERSEIVSVARAMTAAFPEFKVPEPLIDEILYIKALFFGGEATSLTPQDLSVGRQKLEIFRKAANLVLKQSQIFEGKWQPQALSESQARQDFAQAEADSKELIQILKPLAEGSFDLNHIAKLAEAYELLYPAKQPEDSLARQVNELLPVIVRGKELALADSGVLVAREDWPFLLDVLGPLYFRYLEYRYFVQGKSPLLRMPVLGHVKQWVDGLDQLVHQVFLSRGRGETKGISQAEILDVVKTLKKANIWPEAIPTAAIEKLLPVVVTRILTTPEARLRDQIEKGWSPLGEKALLQEIHLFFEAQETFDQLLARGSAIGHSELQKAVSGKQQSSRELARMLSSSLPLALDPEGRLNLSRGNSVYTEDALFRLNIVRAGLRVIIRGYGDAGTAQKLEGIDEDAFKVFFRDLKPTLVEMGLIEAKNTTFASSRFLEGSLFTYYSDGDQFLDYSEGGHLALLIWSGVSMHNMMKAEIAGKCRVSGTRRDWYGIDCGLEIIRRRAGKVMTGMPVMARQLGQGDAEANRLFLFQVLKAAGWAPNTSRVASMSDLSLVPHLLQYIDSLFRRWDRDGNGILDREEALRAEPMFHALLKRVGKLTDDNYVRAAYAYILVNGKAPETFWEKFNFATGWVNKDTEWPIQADRYRVAQILGFIADSIRAGN